MMEARGFRCVLWQNFNNLLQPEAGRLLRGASSPTELDRVSFDDNGLYAGGIFVRDAAVAIDPSGAGLRTPWGQCSRR